MLIRIYDFFSVTEIKNDLKVESEDCDKLNVANYKALIFTCYASLGDIHLYMTQEYMY